MKRLTTLLLLLVCPVDAAAKQEKVYAIRELRVDGEMTEAERQRLRERAFTAAEMVIGGAGGVVVPASDVERVLAERPELRRCYDWRCNVVIADQLRATRVVVVRIERKGAPSAPGAWEVTALSFAADALRLVGSKVESCDGCVAEDLVKRDVLTHVITSLVKQEPADLPLCRLKVDSQPSEAAITIDKTALGFTPLARTVAAGTHTVSVELKGYATHQTVIECPKDGALPLRIKLTPATAQSSPLLPPTGGPEPPPDRRQLYRRLGFVSLGLMVASIAGLGVAAALHERPSCGSERCDMRYNTTPSLALTSVGAAAFGVAAVVLLVKGYSSSSSRTTWIAPTATGIVLGGTF